MHKNIKLQYPFK